MTSQVYKERKTAVREAGSAPAVQPCGISAPELLHVSKAGAPQPMSPALREKFEPGFGADFSNIRISRGHIPDELGVEAVAKGSDILMDSRAGMDVLGHELAHVVQQATGRVAGGYPVVHDASLERQADVQGARVASGMSAEMGGVSGFGGELMSIAPMSSVSAPAQCKSKEEKDAEKELEAKQVKSGGFNFKKRKGDADLQQMKQLMTDYNANPDDPDKEMALMNSAMGYLDKNSRGETLEKKSETELAESIIYQLSMKGGQNQKAMGHLNRLTSGNKTLDELSGGARNEGFFKKGDEAMKEMGVATSGKGPYSKTTQAMMSGVFANQDQTTQFVSQGMGGTKRDMRLNDDGSETPEYTVGANVGNNLDDAIGGALHEFTHASSGQVYGNTGLTMTVRPGASKDELVDEVNDRSSRLQKLKELSTKQEGKIGGGFYTMQSYTDDRAKYGLGSKMYGQYLPGEYWKELRDLKQERNEPEPELPVNDAAKTRIEGELNTEMGAITGNPNASTRQKRVVDEVGEMRRVRGLLRGNGAKPEVTSPDALVEADAVINQMLIQYEHSSKDRSSQYYRELKAAALSSHVKRHNELLRQKKESMPPVVEPEPQPTPTPTVSPKEGQEYVRPQDLPQSGPGWEHTGSTKFGKRMGVYLDPAMDTPTMDLMPSLRPELSNPTVAPAKKKKSWWPFSKK